MRSDQRRFLQRVADAPKESAAEISEDDGPDGLNRVFAWSGDGMPQQVCRCQDGKDDLPGTEHWRQACSQLLKLSNSARDNALINVILHSGGGFCQIVNGGEGHVRIPGVGIAVN
ncbi:hypothetical protein ACWCWQ_35575 [Streptomyces sp. NPDC001571]